MSGMTSNVVRDQIANWLQEQAESQWNDQTRAAAFEEAAQELESGNSAHALIRLGIYRKELKAVIEKAKHPIAQIVHFQRIVDKLDTWIAYLEISRGKDNYDDE